MLAPAALVQDLTTTQKGTSAGPSAAQSKRSDALQLNADLGLVTAPVGSIFRRRPEFLSNSRKGLGSVDKHQYKKYLRGVTEEYQMTLEHTGNGVRFLDRAGAVVGEIQRPPQPPVEPSMLQRTLHLNYKDEVKSNLAQSKGNHAVLAKQRGHAQHMAYLSNVGAINSMKRSLRALRPTL